MTFSRRDFLKVGGSFVALGAAPLSGCADDDPAPSDDALQLDVKFVDLQVGTRNLRVRTYGGAIPGPTITTKPGKQLRIKIVNRLPAYDSSTWNPALMNVPHELNTTNFTEESPALTEDGSTIFFASDRSVSYDIYTSVRNSPTAPFGTPTPVAEVNSSLRDSDVTVSRDGRELIFSSTRSGATRLYRAVRDCE